MNEFRFICARLILDERVLKILSVTERHILWLNSINNRQFYPEHEGKIKHTQPWQVMGYGPQWQPAFTVPHFNQV